ncbi:MAG: hypothetical protein IJ223_04095 [Clostridia bacterium]|nr:hypothetical protein [Clostridia bacterium]
MELTKNIFFNTDKLVPNTTVKISYVGKLFQNDSEEVYIHYGFGLLWENVSEIKMEKTELGFQAEIELQDSESFNFCFRNGLNEWDNNEGENYIFPIEKVDTSLVLIDDNAGVSVHKGLRKSYIWSKKLKLAIYKLIIYVPKLISGNYKRKLTDQDQ